MMGLPFWGGSSADLPAARLTAIMALAGDPTAPGTRQQSRKSKETREKFPNRVLMLGSIRELALYRAEVLGHHGFHTLIPDTEDETAAVIREGDFDVAVLSYTLSDAAVQRYAELIRAERPNCPIIAIAQALRPDRRIEPDSVVLADKGPAELVSALRRVLRQG